MEPLAPKQNESSGHAGKSFGIGRDFFDRHVGRVLLELVIWRCLDFIPFYSGGNHSNDLVRRDSD